MVNELDPISGMMGQESMKVFLEGEEYGEIVGYVESIIDGLFKLSKMKVIETRVLTVCKKIMLRRKIMGKCGRLMPEYVEKMGKWEKEIMEKYKINKDTLGDLGEKKTATEETGIRHKTLLFTESE